MRLFQHSLEPPSATAAQAEDGLCAKARVFWLGQESIYPGWYMQRYVGGRLETRRLEVHEQANILDAVVRAAACLNCPIRAIQVEGPEWPLVL